MFWITRMLSARTSTGTREDDDDADDDADDDISCTTTLHHFFFSLVTYVYAVVYSCLRFAIGDRRPSKCRIGNAT